jgi:YidC/Oxa1 family membrane protein insertase
MNFNFFFDLIGAALAALYSLVPSMAFAIGGLTLIVMVVLTPLTLKGTRSMMMMQQLQPEMKKLQSKYKDDRQKLNEEMLKFYKENNINPVGGCLPLLIQMPVFLVLYNVLRGLTQRVPVMGANIGWTSAQSALHLPLSKTPVYFTNFQPYHIPTDSTLYQTLVTTNTMPFLGMDLAQSCQNVLSTQGIVSAIPYALLILVVGITGYVQQWQIQGRNQNQQTNPQQQMIMKIMPIFLPVISFGLPAGLVLYFAISNLYRVGQQWFISRSIYGIRSGSPRDGGGSGPSDRGDKTGSGSGGGATKERAKVGANGAGKTGGRSSKADVQDAVPDDDDEVMAAPRSRSNGANGAKGSSRSPAKAPANAAAKRTASKTPAKSTKSSPASSASSAKPAKATSGRTTPSSRPNGGNQKSSKVTSSARADQAPAAPAKDDAKPTPAKPSGAPAPLQPRARKKKG